MENKKLLWKLVNALNAVLLFVYISKVLHWYAYPHSFNLYIILILAGVIYAAKSWIEIKYKVPNLIKKNKLTRGLYYLGGGFFIMGMMFKIMHWPSGNIQLVFGGFMAIASHLILFFVDDSESNKTKSNPDILDDF